MSLWVVLRPVAVQDLQDIRNWYELRLAGLGVKFANRAAAALDTLG